MRIICILFTLLFCLSAHAYVRTMSTSGYPLYWTTPTISWSANYTNDSGLSANSVGTMFQNSFSAWTNIGGYNQFSYSQSSNSPARSAFDGINAVYFNSTANRPMDWGVVAMTEVLYYTSSGQIAETDMVFNDTQFLFTSTAGDTGKIINGKVAIFLQDVATHEAGHAIGLDHSAVGRSSLIYTAFSGQFQLGDDDKAAVQTVFPATGNLGSFRGKVRGLNGGIFGAHVLAINTQTGKVQAGTLSAADGSFRLGDIPAGDYAFLLEPFYTDISSVSPYYQNVNHRFCENGKFRRRFYSKCDSNGKATVLSLKGNDSLDLGTLSPTCSQLGNPGGAPLTLASAKEINGSQFGTLFPGDTHYYKITNTSGHIEARVATYSLYSPIDTKVEILNLDGTSISSATSIDNVENPMPGGYINYDSSAEATNLPLGNYLLKVTAAAQKIGSSKFPAGFDLLDGSGHYLLMVGLNGEYGAESPTDMSSCLSVNNSTQTPSFRAPASKEKEQDMAQGCGSLSGSGPSSGLFSGAISQLLFLAILVRILASFPVRALVRRKR